MPALLLTAKGKLCADVFVWIDGESLIVEADALLEEALPARLERYAVSDDVAFELLPPVLSVVMCLAPSPQGGDGLRTRRLGVEGVDVASPPHDLPEAGRDEVELLRIERGLPRWGRELSEDTLAQEVGLDRTAVDFNKGCYVGQEVVSRIHSVGRVNRHLCGFVGDFDPSRAGAATLVDAGGRKAGRLTSARCHPDERPSRLAFSKGNRPRRRSPSKMKVVLALARRNVLNFLFFPDEKLVFARPCLRNFPSDSPPPLVRR